jgi:hypothetical protein
MRGSGYWGVGGGHSVCILLFFGYHFYSLSGDLIPETCLKINSINLKVLK